MLSSSVRIRPQRTIIVPLPNIALSFNCVTIYVDDFLVPNRDDESTPPFHYAALVEACHAAGSLLLMTAGNLILTLASTIILVGQVLELSLEIVGSFVASLACG